MKLYVVAMHSPDTTKSTLEWEYGKLLCSMNGAAIAAVYRSKESPDA